MTSNFNAANPKSFEIVGESHVGLVRKVNEDSFCCIHYPQESNVLAVVADGVGGHGGGDLASSLCCRRIAEEWQLGDAGKMSDPEQLKNFLRQAIERANLDIYEKNCRLKRRQPMGSTIVAAVFTADFIVYAHAGDSRLYRLREGWLEQLTEDHSLRAAVLRRTHGEIDPASLPAANIICKALGPACRCEPDLNALPYRAGDRFLLCSDGLTNHLDNTEIGDILRTANTARAALNQFMRQALIRGGSDNITAICVF